MNLLRNLSFRASATLFSTLALSGTLALGALSLMNIAKANRWPSKFWLA